MTAKLLVATLSLLLLASTAFALIVYISPPMIVITQYVKNNVVNVVPGEVEVANINDVPVTVHLSSADYIQFEENDFVLQPGQFRNVSFYAAITKWGGYSSFVDARYRRTSGSPLAWSATAPLQINALHNGTATNTHAPTAPVITEPPSGSLINGPLTLRWLASTDEDPSNTMLVYYVVVDNDPDFSSPIINTSTVDLEKTVNLQPGYVYYWKVIAYDGKFYTESVPGTGQTANQFPTIPILAGPSNGAVVSDEPLLLWSISSDPEGTPVRYDLLVDNNTDFSSPEINVQWLVNTNYDTKGKLNEGTYYWKVRSRDSVGSAGYSSVRSFTLDCLDAYCYNMQITNPLNNTYDTKKISLNLTINKDAKYIYKAFNSRTFTRICSDCSDVDKPYTGKEGLNNLTIKIIGYNGEELLQTIFFTIDTTKPRVSSILPKDKSLVSGTVFTIKYTEQNLQSIDIHYGPNAENQAALSNCPRGSNKVCSIDLDLSAYDGQSVLYYFIVRDNFRAVASKTYNITVDSTPPLLTLMLPVNGATLGNNNVRVEAVTNEKVSLTYSDNGGTFRTLCSSCTFYGNNKYFKNGAHTIVVRAVDKAGNIAEQSVSFTVV